MEKNKLFFLFLIGGAITGLCFGLIKARATSPESPEVSGGNPPTIYYDEVWNATNATYTTEHGYRNFNPNNSATHEHLETPDEAAKFGNKGGPGDPDYIKVFPKFVVREWTVHGHIHFE
jgi:hypothetical protein